MEATDESMQSPLYLLSSEASIDATGEQIPSPNLTDYYVALWSMWMRAVAPGLHAHKIQRLMHVFPSSFALAYFHEIC
jgi:hypothetical protein